MTRVFDTSTVKGLQAAERFQSQMYNKFESVNVYPVGLTRVQVVASRPIGAEAEDDLERARR